MTATMNAPGIKLLEKVGKRVILSMNVDMYEYISEDLEMRANKEILVKKYEDSLKSGIGFSI